MTIKHSKENHAKEVDLIGTTNKLARLMLINESAIEMDLVSLSKNIIKIECHYQPEDTKQYPMIYKLIEELFIMTIQDIEKGIVLLQSSYLGLQHKGNKVSTFISALEAEPPPKMLYSITWMIDPENKNYEASQDEVNISLYAIAYHWYKIKKEQGLEQ